MFHDRARIHVQAGRGGDGSLHFRREKHVPKGGPDGGDGGRGGDVVLVADPDLRDLSNFRSRKRFKAGRAGGGTGALKHGADGETVELVVPVGTQVFDEDDQLVADLAAPGARVVVARGGIGGRGNKRFATPTRQTPRYAETGLPGEEAELELRLKLLADAALAGLPNAGKSSLLARISNARPKVAEYPFTTIQPVLGTVDSPSGRQLTVADVPGLIEGASEGLGLGHEFLAHLERARLIVHVVDCSEDDVDERIATINDELAAYGAGLDERPQVIVLNKTDLLPEPPVWESRDPARAAHLRALVRDRGRGGGVQARAVRALPRRAGGGPGPGRRAAGVPRLQAAARASGGVSHLPHRPRLPGRRRGARRGGARRGAEGCRRPQGRHGRGRRAGAGTRVTIGLLGGAFDPPHVGHVALARAAIERFELERLVVLVVADPGHKGVEAPAEARLALAEAAFDGLAEVRLDEFPRTVDSLRAGAWEDPLFLVGADQFADFLSWTEPDAVLDLARLGVATRPGYPQEKLETVLAGLRRPERVLFFDIEPTAVSSTEVRERVARGEPVDGLVPPGVAALIAELRLYVR